MIRKDKFIIIVLSIICGGLIITTAILGSRMSRQKKQIKDANELIEWQHELIEKLGSLDAVNCSITFEVNNKAVFGSIKNGDLEQVANATMHYLRKELIEQKKDSICTN